MGPSTLSYPVKSYQPLNLLYRLLKVSSILARLPLWILKAALPSLRPYPKWTFKQALMRNFVLHMVDMTSSIGITETLSLAPGKEKDRWAIVDPFEDACYVGPLLSPTVKPAKTGGTWYGVATAPRDAAAAAAMGFSGANNSNNNSSSNNKNKNKKIALHIHGGAFVIGDGRQAATGYLGSVLTGPGGFDAVFMPQYRLAGYRGRDPFPAALQDCLTAYLYLVRTLGLDPADVTVSGDSAGGNLAIGLLRYLERFGGGGGGRVDDSGAASVDAKLLAVKPPGRVVLLSPWVQPSASLHTRYETWDQYGTDFLPRRFLQWGVRTYLLQATATATGTTEQPKTRGVVPGQNEWVDVLGHPFRTTTPVFLTWAEREILGVDCAKFAEEMKGLNNGGDGAWRLEVNIEAGAPHDTLLLGDVLGWERSAEEVARKIAKFVEEN